MTSMVIVEVEWLDAGGWSGWHSSEDVDVHVQNTEDRMIHSVGYFVGETDTELTLACSQTVPRNERNAAPRSWGDVLTIPKSEIRWRAERRPRRERQTKVTSAPLRTSF